MLLRTNPAFLFSPLSDLDNAMKMASQDESSSRPFFVNVFTYTRLLKCSLTSKEVSSVVSLSCMNNTHLQYSGSM